MGGTAAVSSSEQKITRRGCAESCHVHRRPLQHLFGVLLHLLVAWGIFRADGREPGNQLCHPRRFRCLPLSSLLRLHPHLLFLCCRSLCCRLLGPWRSLDFRLFLDFLVSAPGLVLLRSCQPPPAQVAREIAPRPTIHFPWDRPKHHRILFCFCCCCCCCCYFGRISAR